MLGWRLSGKDWAAILFDGADNIEALRGWCKTRFEGMENQLESFFEEVRSDTGLRYYSDAICCSLLWSSCTGHG